MDKITKDLITVTHNISFERIRDKLIEVEIATMFALGWIMVGYILAEAF